MVEPENSHDVAARQPSAVEESARQVRLRLYPGGSDEQDIQVQRSLPNPPRGIVTETIVNEE